MWFPNWLSHNSLQQFINDIRWLYISFSGIFDKIGIIIIIFANYYFSQLIVFDRPCYVFLLSTRCHCAWLVLFQNFRASVLMHIDSYDILKSAIISISDLAVLQSFLLKSHWFGYLAIATLCKFVYRWIWPIQYNLFLLHISFVGLFSRTQIS